MIALKPCPLCKYGDVDNDEGIYKSGEFFVIRCGACFLTIDGRNKQELITRWNTRAPSKLSKGITEIEMMHEEAMEDMYDLYAKGITRGFVRTLNKLKQIEAE